MVKNYLFKQHIQEVGIDFNNLSVVNMNIVVGFKVVDCRQVVSIMSGYILVNHTSRIATAVVE
jgi:hypothetical protein